jgi:hypothetical protein
MAIHFRCPTCADRYDLDDDLAGRLVKCRNCSECCRVGGDNPLARPSKPATTSRPDGPPMNLGPVHAWLQWCGVMVVFTAVMGAVVYSKVDLTHFYFLAGVGFYFLGVGHICSAIRGTRKDTNVTSE